MKKSIFLFFAAIMCAMSTQAKVVYFKNTSNWTASNVKCYYWDGVTAPSWPGKTMTRIGSTSYYYLDIGAAKQCIFSNNGNNQSADLTSQDGKLFHYSDNKWYSNFSVDNFTIYFDARNATDWKNPHMRIGRTDWCAAYPLTLVAGTYCLYSLKTPAWDNYAAYTITNSAGYTNSHNIYQPSDEKPEGEYAITKLINYQSGNILENKYITASEWEKNEDDADYWKVTVANTLPSYKVNYSQTGVGTLTVTKYTGSKYEALTSGSSVQPTQIIKIETNANCKLTVTGATQIDGGNTYYVTANTTIKAEFPSTVKFAAESTNWDQNATSFTTNGNTATLDLTLTRGTYEFKIIETIGSENIWYGNNGIMTRQYHDNWIFRTKNDENNDEVNAQIKADVEGIYKLTWDFVTNELSVTYPTFPDLSNQPNPIYFQPTEAWKSDNARFAAYFFDDETGAAVTWKNLTDDDGDGVYEVSNDKKYLAVIFVRMNSANNENRWNTDEEDHSADKPVWNKTGDLLIPMDGNDCFKMIPKNDEEWDNSGEWSLYVPTIQLVDGDNSATLTKYNGKTVNAQVNRTFKANDGYYTICVPFNMPANVIGKAYQIQEILDNSAEGLTVNFIEGTTTILAGQPYLVEPSDDLDDGFTVENVTIDNSTPAAVTVSGAGVTVTMQGKYSRDANTNGLYWVGNGGYLYNDNVLTTGLCAYFNITTPSGISPRMRVATKENTTTGLDNIINGENTVIKTIENGQLIIIRNGEKFNAQGQRL